YKEPSDFESSWARLPAGTFEADRFRLGRWVSIWSERSDSVDVLGKAALGTWDAREQGLGGWSLDVHHAYDPNARVLYMGTGERRSARQIGPVIQRLAGGGFGFGGDGGPARDAFLDTPADIAVAADGRMFIADTFNHRIRVVGTDGVISTFAGNGERCVPDDDLPLPIVTDPVKASGKAEGPCGDGGSATAAFLTAPEGVAVGPDGSVYIADTGVGCVRRVAPDGIIATFAGFCGGEAGGGLPPPAPLGRSPDKDSLGGEGDGGEATQAFLSRPVDVAVAPDGGVYIADSGDRRIRHVAPDGVITTVAGGGFDRGADGDRAVDVDLGNPTGIAVGPNGDLFVAEQSGNQVRRVSVDGRVYTVAGTGFAGDLGDGGPAVEAQLINPWKVAVGRDGSVFLSELFNARIRRVSPGGTIATAVGDGDFGNPREGGLATGVSLGTPGGLELSPAGTLVFADHTNGGIFEAGLALEGFSEDEIVIADESGARIFVFDSSGRHLRTAHALTGADLLRFRYDDGGLLQEIENGDGLITRIERNAAGEPTRIVAPFGQETVLSLDPNGYLASVANPAGETRRFTYDGLGRLTAWTDALDAETTAAYDTLGRLRRETDPEGGFKQLDRRSVDLLTTEVTLTTAEGRTTRYETRRDQFSARSTITAPDGLARTQTSLPGGSSTVVFSDGTQVSAAVRPDPRFGMASPIAASQRLTLPSGLSWNSSFQRSVSLSDPADPLSLTTLQDTVVVNGKTFTRQYSRAQSTLLRTTPEGRVSTSRIDDLGRLTDLSFGNLEPTRFVYDEQGRLASVRRGTGTEERFVELDYDTSGRLVSVTDPLGLATGFAYDDADRL
ncbi:MAG: hypothetical protein V3T72_03940, partial [Thermoanaerobaculia bacterium]